MSPSSAEPAPSPAQDLARVATFLDRACANGRGRWMIAGPGADTLTHGTIPVGELACIGSGDGMVAALDALTRPDDAGMDTAMDQIRAAATRLGLFIDATWTRDRFTPDRPLTARAFRVALGLAREHDFNVGGQQQHLRLDVASPLGVYLTELALSFESPRQSDTREFHARRAGDAYRNLADGELDRGLDEIAHLERSSFRERRQLGIRRGDAEEFRRWHERFLRDRSPRANHHAVANVTSGVRKAVDWVLGRDLEPPEPPSFGR